MVQYRSFVSYDGVNLLSDIGGTLGLFLGWSIAFSANVFMKVLKIKRMRSLCTYFIVVILICGFIQWSVPVFYKFVNEDETIEFQTER